MEAKKSNGTLRWRVDRFHRPISQGVHKNLTGNGTSLIDIRAILVSEKNGWDFKYYFGICRPGNPQASGYFRCVQDQFEQLEIQWRNRIKRHRK